MSSNHPLPAPPAGHQQLRPGQSRERTKSTFSFRSNHSRKSSGSGHKVDLFETHEEKQSRRLTTKADPSMAITEAEPSAVASGVKSSLLPIRALQHRDASGNPIADPDRSNPTRSRWERPLDTIRAFEAAIDGNSSRKSFIRPSPGDAQSNYNRRSYYGGPHGHSDERPRVPQNGYYGNGGRAQSYRPDSQYIDGRPNAPSRPESYYHSGTPNGPANGYHPNRARFPRTASEPQFNNGSGIYPVPGNQQSYETVTTASGSGSSQDPVGYSTDPSSENSSVDRIAPLPHREPAEMYGFSGFGGKPQLLPPGSSLQDQQSHAAQRQGNGYPEQRPPAVPRKGSANTRGSIKLGPASGNAQPPYEGQRPQVAEKRKSWLSKRFSKA